MVVRYFALRTSQDGREDSVFTGRNPRQAALKAASRGNTSIFLRERGTAKLHEYRGVRRKVNAPSNRPDWMPAVVWKPNVKKARIIHFKKAKKVKAKRVKARKGGARKAKRRRR